MIRSSLLAISFAALTPVIQTPEDIFSRLDKDGNSFISHQEAQSLPEFAGQWGVLNTDHNEGVSRLEFTKFKPMNDQVTWVNSDYS